MNTIYAILLAAIVFMLLVFRFMRVDQTKQAADETDKGKGTGLLDDNPSQQPESQDLFAPQQEAVTASAAEQATPVAASDIVAGGAEPSPEVTTNDKPDEPAANEAPAQTEKEPVDDHTLVIYAVGQNGVFTGAALLEMVAAENLSFENNVFCKYDEENNVCYRVLNGTGHLGFEDIKAANFQTQVITITMSFADTRNPLRAYSEMRRFVELMVQSLGAELHDAEENRISLQTLNYYKDNVVSYQMASRKRLG